MKTLVVLPSYNERENIVQLIEAIHGLSEGYDVCVVDDNSPDGTAKLLEEFKSKLTGSVASRFNLIIRQKKDGRGGAVRAGLKWGIEQASKNYQTFVEMDCDFSHPPTDIPKGIGLLNQFDVVLGSRYPDGEIIGWPYSRRLFSFVSNSLARVLLSWQIADYTNGFRFYTRRSTELILNLPQKNKGYIYLSETISYFLQHDLRIGSFPIRFVNRERGVSNTNFKEISSALKGIFTIAWNYRFSGSGQ